MHLPKICVVHLVVWNAILSAILNSLSQPTNHARPPIEGSLHQLFVLKSCWLGNARFLLKFSFHFCLFHFNSFCLTQSATTLAIYSTLYLLLSFISIGFDCAFLCMKVVEERNADRTEHQQNKPIKLLRNLFSISVLSLMELSP